MTLKPSECHVTSFCDVYCCGKSYNFGAAIVELCLNYLPLAASRAPIAQTSSGLGKIASFHSRPGLFLRRYGGLRRIHVPAWVARVPLKTMCRQWL